MSAKYFYTVKGVRQGPVMIEELNSLAARQELKRSDLIWTEGMATWQRAGVTSSIFEGLPPDLEPLEATIPPLPNAPATQISSHFAWYLQVLKNYAVFDGRAGRREFWTFFFVNLVVSFALWLIEGVLGGSGVMYFLYSLAVIIPNLAVGIRRMHDTDRSGWWILLPIANIIFWAEEGKPGANRFGPTPRTAVP